MSDISDASTNGNDPDEINNDENKVKENCISLILTNARSLALKVASLIDMIRELGVTCAAVTETWFRGGAQLRQELGDIEQASGIKIICRNRAANGGSARGGGVALAFNTNACNFKERRINNKCKHEILCTFGTVGKIKRKVVIFVIYIPPSTPAGRLTDLIDTLGEAVASIKVALGDPIMFVTGDFNGRDIAPAFDVDPDMTLIPTAPTRGANLLDLVFTNVPDLVKLADVRAPLESETGSASDHGCVHVEAVVPATRNFVWTKRTVRKRSDSADERFAHDLSNTGWDFRPDDGPDHLVRTFENRIAALTDKHFPLQTIRARSNEDPWITNGIRRRDCTRDRAGRRLGKGRTSGSRRRWRRKGRSLSTR